MNIEKITLYIISQKLRSPFTSSLETVSERESILLEITDEDGYCGWGEVVAFSSPWYTEETIKTASHIIEDFLVEKLLSKAILHPIEVNARFATIKRNQMAKAGLEMAVWDLYAKRLGVSLSNLIGGTRRSIESGVAVGIDSLDVMIAMIRKYVEQGYKRIKIKIKPGQDIELIQGIRHHFPTLPLMADANSAYSLNELPLLKAIDDFKLMMIEQPLASDDIIDHAKIQKVLNTPICLDESITSYEDARKAIELGSCKVMNIKIGRVGGLSEAINIHNLCMDYGIPIWCGGMLETGISRAFNIALASLPNFSLPGDISASANYWLEDVIVPEVTVNNGLINVPNRPGIGFEINKQLINQLTKAKKVFTN